MSGKGGGSTSTVAIPEYIEAAAQRNLNKAERISQLGYVPEYGPTVAAFTPMQQAAFQNTADAASAFGMGPQMSQQDMMGGMPAPTTYAGGVQGYSSAPIYEQMLSELEARRPGQKSYIDSFFIDPYSGEYAYQPTDYTQYNTAAEDARQREAADRENDLAIAQAQAGPQDTVLSAEETQRLAEIVGGPGYDPATDILTDAQRAAVMSNTPEGTAARIAQEDLAMGVTGGANNNFYDDLRTSPLGDAAGISPSFDDPLSTGSYGGSLVTGGPSQSSQDFFDSVNQGSNFDGSDTNVGNYGGDRDGDGIPNALDFDDGVGYADKSRNGGGGGGGGGGDGCVVATHAVSSGAFTPNTKREAVVWCMKALHGKWWGEAVRRGYRHLGTKKIEQGKAREHYEEFRRYIDFASGKKRTLKGALTFTLRTAQFFAVGLVKKDA